MKDGMKMEVKRDNDFPAYPGNEKNDDGSHYFSNTGMTLRDHFAGQALVGLVAFDRPNGPNGDNKPEHFARWAYAIADAMLAARQP